jgi:hypothetical protein
MTTTSCNEWLDVKPEGQTPATEMFESYSGFCDVMNGCYIKLKERSIYGEKLTMSDIEELAALWRSPNKTALPSAFEMYSFDYKADNAKKVLSDIYSGLYNVIANANMVLANVETKASVFPDDATRNIIMGEALAIRAFCHFDVLRLFGQLPQNATTQVSLPYAEAVSISELPPYYNYAQFTAKIEADLTKAESLLKDNDPVFDYTFTQLNTSLLEDDYMNYRQNRFNFWAVRALLARFYLYTGNKAKAYETAKTIIQATGADGNPVLTLSGGSDMTSGYLACPSECMLMLNVYNLASYSSTIFAEGWVMDTHYALTADQLTTLFNDQNVASNNRYLYLWNRASTNPTGVNLPTLKKYWYDVDAVAGSTLKRQVIPLIRMSELYLIMMETTSNLAEANALWTEYQLSHNVLITENYFTGLDDVLPKVIDEYRRELIGEGQLFYTYKRLNVSTMLWRTETVREDNYIVPLPETEFNPNL